MIVSINGVKVITDKLIIEIKVDRFYQITSENIDGSIEQLLRVEKCP